MRSLIACICLFWSCTLCAQFSIGIKVMGLTFHPKPSPHAHLYPNKKDVTGQWVQIGGLFFTADWEISPNKIALHAAQALFLDCSNQFAGFTHFGIKGIYRNGVHTVSASMGPSWFYRKSWRQLPGYVDEGLFAYNDKWQHSFYWYAGSVEYDYQLSESHSLTLNCIPGWPEVFVFSGGIKQHLNNANQTGSTMPPINIRNH